MRVIVRFHESARVGYESWQARLSREPIGSHALARLHAEELIRQFEIHDGVPEGARFRSDLDPPAWIWRFSSDTWVQFIRRTRKVGLWGQVAVEILVTGLRNHPPD
jgi:hypothetical protein